MRKIFKLLLTVSAAMILTSCSSQPEESEKIYPEAFVGLELSKSTELTNRFTPYNLENLEENSDAIVIGTFVGDTEQKEIYLYDEQVEKDTLVNIITYGSIEVSEVYKGDFKKGDVIKTAQEYGVMDNEYISFSDLTPMLEGDTWLFFLFNNYDSGIYYCMGDCDGRYPVKDHKYRSIALTDNEDLGVFDKENFNERIYGEILEKYEF